MFNRVCLFFRDGEKGARPKTWGLREEDGPVDRTESCSDTGRGGIALPPPNWVGGPPNLAPTGNQ